MLKKTKLNQLSQLNPASLLPKHMATNQSLVSSTLAVHNTTTTTACCWCACLCKENHLTLLLSPFKASLATF